VETLLDVFQHFKKSFKYLGNEVGQGQVCAISAKISTIIDYPAPIGWLLQSVLS